MKLSLHAVRLKSNSDGGAAASTIAFDDKLTVIRGENSRGKSQCLAAVIWTLGLEDILSPRGDVPLGSAMTSEILLQGPHGEVAHRVRSSWCALEMANERGDVLTVWRSVVGTPYERNLIRVWRGPAITNHSAATRDADYFVVRPGGAQSDSGFHRLLADFIGWDLPKVSRYAGPPAPLYVQILFAFLLIDQRSWGLSGPRAVTRYQLREPTRRAIEFLLGLEGPAAQQRRDRLETEQAELRSDWNSRVATLEAMARTVGGRIQGLPSTPAGARSGGRSVVASDLSEVLIEVFSQGEWTPAETAIQKLGAASQLPQERRLAEDTSTDVDLRALEEQLEENLLTSAMVEQSLALSESEKVALERRIDGLTDENQRNLDVRALRRLGSTHDSTHLADDSCPTCRQSLSALEADDIDNPLDIDQTIGLIQTQLATARAMYQQATITVEQSRSTFAAVQREIDGLRARVRAARADSVGAANDYSARDVAAAVTAQTRLAELDRLSSTVRIELGALGAIAEKIAENRRQLAALPTEVPPADIAKLDALTANLVSELSEYGFDSYPPHQIELNAETLKPQRSGFDLDLDVSASDVVRIKISYVNALREIAAGTEAPHPRLLFMDEPRQHELREAHFSQMLTRFAADGDNLAAQTIVTSAATEEDLRRMLTNVEVSVVDLGDRRLLQLDQNLDPLDPEAG